MGCGTATESSSRLTSTSPVCSKRFNRPSSLNTHMAVHTGAKREWEPEEKGMRLIKVMFQRTSVLAQIAGADSLSARISADTKR